jgi:hypothetical protein
MEEACGTFAEHSGSASFEHDGREDREKDDERREWRRV